MLLIPWTIYIFLKWLKFEVAFYLISIRIQTLKAHLYRFKNDIIKGQMAIFGFLFSNLMMSKAWCFFFYYLSAQCRVTKHILQNRYVHIFYVVLLCLILSGALFKIMEIGSQSLFFPAPLFIFFESRRYDRKDYHFAPFNSKAKWLFI